MASNKLTDQDINIQKQEVLQYKCLYLCIKRIFNLYSEKSMLDLSLIEQNQIKDILRVPMSQIPSQQIIDLALTLFPLQTLTDPIDLLYKNLWTFYNIRTEKKIEFDLITQQVLEKAKQRGNTLHSVLQIAFQSEFMTKFKKRLLKSRGLIKPPPKAQSQTVPTQNDDGTERKVFAFGAPKEGTQAKVFGQHTTPLVSSDNRSVSSKNSNKASNVPSSKEKAISSTSKIPIIANNIVTEGGAVVNLSDQVMCFCGKHVSLIDPTKQLSLLCCYCNKRYHKQCIKRPTDARICPFCHLKKMIPNRQTRKVLFVGLLMKGKKKHEISFYLTQSDLSIQFKIQVRCFRLKEGCSNIILFPDASTFYVKNINVKEFSPIHRQSSLKYRKDEPFYLSAGLHPKENKLTVVEKHPSKENKDDRIVLENHLIGIYLIEEKKNQWLVREYKQNCFTTFTESKQMLDNLFSKGSIGDQISCEVLKIPLTCTLTTEKIKIPARGAQCNHYQCFDLKNYLDLITNSTNPRWLCPLCRQPSYEFKLDIILFHILELHKHNDKISEVIFLRTGEFKVFQNEDKESTSEINNIYNLPIESKFKRIPPESVDLGQLRKK